MSNAIRIKDEEGNAREYRVPPWREWTIADWRRLCLPIHDLTGLDAFHEELKRVSGIPLKYLRRLPAAEVDKLVDAILAIRNEAEAARNAADDIAKRWEADGPKVVEFDGTRWTCPASLDMGTTYGQWVDLDNALDGAQHEPEVMAAICACLLVEEGKEYEGYHLTLERFDRMPVAVAMQVCAFFLNSSERLRNAIARYTSRLAMSLQHVLGQAEATLTSGTAHGTD